MTKFKLPTGTYTDVLRSISPSDAASNPTRLWSERSANGLIFMYRVEEEVYLRAWCFKPNHKTKLTLFPVTKPNADTILFDHFINKCSIETNRRKIDINNRQYDSLISMAGQAYTIILDEAVENKGLQIVSSASWLEHQLQGKEKLKTVKKNLRENRFLPFTLNRGDRHTVATIVEKIIRDDWSGMHLREGVLALLQHDLSELLDKSPVKEKSSKPLKKKAINGALSLAGNKR